MVGSDFDLCEAGLPAHADDAVGKSYHMVDTGYTVGGINGLHYMPPTPPAPSAQGWYSGAIEAQRAQAAQQRSVTGVREAALKLAIAKYGFHDVAGIIAMAIDFEVYLLHGVMPAAKQPEDGETGGVTPGSGGGGGNAGSSPDIKKS